MWSVFWDEEGVMQLFDQLFVSSSRWLSGERLWFGVRGKFISVVGLPPCADQSFCIHSRLWSCIPKRAYVICIEQFWLSLFLIEVIFLFSYLYLVVIGSYVQCYWDLDCLDINLVLYQIRLIFSERLRKWSGKQLVYFLFNELQLSLEVMHNFAVN